jgi:hypothetical protein
MRPIREDCLHQGGGLRADGAGPVDEARGRPLEVVLVRLRHVGGVGGVLASDEAPGMGGDALAAMKDFDGRRGQAGVDVLVHERGGDGVVMAVQFDVIVDVDAGADLPVAVDEGFRGERAERGLIQALEKFAAAGPVEPHRPRVEIREKLGDAGVEGGEGEEGLVPETSEDPPFGDLDRDFDFRFLESCRVQPAPLIRRRF